MSDVFRDRVEAGQLLASRLGDYANRDDVIVLAIPAGGVPVGFEVACRLHASLDILPVRKIEATGRPDMTMAAIGPDGLELRDDPLIWSLKLRPGRFEEIASRARTELQREQRHYRGDQALPALAARTVVLVDDGVATGFTMQAAIRAVRAKGATSIVVAVPVTLPGAVEGLRREATKFVTLLIPPSSRTIAQCYGDFLPPSRDEISSLLLRAAVRSAGASTRQRPGFPAVARPATRPAD